METNVKIKKITRKIYNIDYSKITLRDDDEFILQSNGVSEFTQMLKKFDKAMSEMDFKVLHQYLNWGDRNVISDMHENDKAIEIEG